MQAASANGATRLRLAVIDDDAEVRQLLERVLEAAGMRLTLFSSGAEFIRSGGAGAFDVVVTDFQMPRASGLDVLKACRAEPEPPEVLLVTGFATIRNAVEAMRLGAFDYLTKPIDPDELLRRVNQAVEMRRMRMHVSALEREVGRRRGVDALIADSAPMRRLLEQARKAAESDSTVLLLGETGTGKDVLARFIQSQSPRAGRPYLTLDCASLAEEFLERELFGHAAGVFADSGAKRGLFEEADGGTLLLDEISALSARGQEKLLQLLSEGTVRRIGENRPRELDVRILASSNRDLLRLVAARAFRDDLYFRFSVVTLRLPPLRERPTDIAPLASHFLEEASRRVGKMRVFAPETLEWLSGYGFPGNVRELRHAVEQAVVLSDDGVLRPSDFTLVGGRLSPDEDLDDEAWPAGSFPRARITPGLLRSALTENGGNRARTARALGISRATLYRLLGRDPTVGGRGSAA